MHLLFYPTKSSKCNYKHYNITILKKKTQFVFENKSNSNNIFVIHYYLNCDTNYIELSKNFGNDIKFYAKKSKTNYFELYINSNKQTINDSFLLKKILQEKMRRKECLSTVTNNIGLIVDSNGNLCNIKDKNNNNCCQNSLKNYKTELCLNINSCYSNYLTCILCCLKNKIDIDFIECQNKCRTSSKSLFEGNKYIKYRNIYCYNDSLIEKDWEMSINKLNVNTSIFIGKKGKSCDDICSQRKLKCLDRYLDYVNRCNAMKRYFKNCQKCVFGDDYYLPGFNSFTGQCFLRTTLQDASLCNAKGAYSQRLCICIH